ncbi:MAG: uroporphyrinogen decarboxylase family protein [Brevefilum sp.]
MPSSAGKTRLLKTLKHENQSNVPWVPFAGVHAGKLKGHTAVEVLTNGEKLLESLLEVNRLYDPDGQPVLFDLQVEAEILGCDLAWAEDAPPSVASHPLTGTKDIPVKLPQASQGRLPMILEVMREMKSAVGETTALYGLITGPFTLASHLRGTDIFLDTMDDPDYVHALMDYTQRVALQMASLYLEAGMDIIAVVDPVTSQVSPRTFTDFLAEPFQKVFDFIRAEGAFSSFFVCGDATKNIDVMCQTHPDCIAVDENIDMVKVKPITDQYNIVLQGNIPLTTIMLLGNQQDNMKYVVDLLDKLPNHQNLIISPGCDMPYETPVENVIAAVEAIRDPDNTRMILANYQAEEIDLDTIKIPEYNAREIPLMEVFTLDSATCAACSYMLDAAKRAAQSQADQVEMVEYKITQPENVARMKKMGIKNLPCILINGDLKFSSLIPSQRELIKAIQDYRNQSI